MQNKKGSGRTIADRGDLLEPRDRCDNRDGGCEAAVADEHASGNQHKQQQHTLQNLALLQRPCDLQQHSLALSPSDSSNDPSTKPRQKRCKLEHARQDNRR